jgi:PAS domain S-box-containing protein
MPNRPISKWLPTLDKLRRRLGPEGDFPRRHTGATAIGIAVLLALSVGFIIFALHEHRNETRRNDDFTVMRIAYDAQEDLISLAVAIEDPALNAQPEALQLILRRERTFLHHVALLESYLHEDREKRTALREIAAGFQKWMNTYALPEVTARSQHREAGERPGGAQNLRSSLLQVERSQLSAIVRDAENLVETNHHVRAVRQLFQTAGLVTLGALAISFLAASSWVSYKAFRKHLQKAETAGAQIRAIIDNTLDGVITVDENGVIQSLNPAAERMFVQEAGNVIGQSVSLLIPQRLFFYDMKNAGRGSIMAVGQRQGYYPFPIEISLSAMEVMGRKQFVAMVRDVSERQRSEDTLRQISIGVSTTTGEEFLRSLLKQLSKALRNDFAFMVELVGKAHESASTIAIAEQGNIRTTGAYDLTHTACAEVLAKGFRVHPGGVRKSFPEDSVLQELMAEGFVATPLIDHKGRAVGVIGVIDRKPLGETRIIESTLQIFAARAAAEIERKRSEEDLAAEKERLAVTLRSIADGFITIDNDGRVLMLNSIAERLTGWSQLDASGRQLAEVFNILHGHNRRRCSHALQRIVAAGHAEGIDGPTILVAYDGAERMIESNAAPIRERSNRKVGAVIVFRDVTEKLRMEEERQKADKLESLGVVAGGIAHDFNNLLTAILGNISLAMVGNELDGNASERLKSAKKATHRAQELAQQLLTFAKGGAPIKQTASIGQLLRDTLSLTLHGSKVFCDFQLPADLWPVEIDPGQVSQVINNLAINADQAMPAGGTLRITGENIDLPTASVSLGLHSGRWVKISLKDQGIGIPAEYLKKIFDPYFTTKPKGSGLGLATVYSIVKNHGGVIGVESEPGAGSSFTFCLPASEKELLSESNSEVPRAPANARVLVLDDEEAICMLVTCALEPLGYDVTEVNDGLSAIVAYQKAMDENRPFDLVISDLTIPGGLGGQETIKRLLEIDPDVCAIVSSGYANDPVMSRHENYGFRGMIAKPYEIDALGRKVAEVLATPRRTRVIFHNFETAAQDTGTSVGRGGFQEAPPAPPSEPSSSAERPPVALV